MEVFQETADQGDAKISPRRLTTKIGEQITQIGSRGNFCTFTQPYTARNKQQSEALTASEGETVSEHRALGARRRYRPHTPDPHPDN